MVQSSHFSSFKLFVFMMWNRPWGRKGRSLCRDTDRSQRSWKKDRRAMWVGEKWKIKKKHVKWTNAVWSCMQSSGIVCMQAWSHAWHSIRGCIHNKLFRDIKSEHMQVWSQKRNLSEIVAVSVSIFNELTECEVLTLCWYLLKLAR